MSVPAFDTLVFVKKLTSVGVKLEQAEMQAELQSQILSGLTDRLATKEDMAHFATKEDLLRFSFEMKEDMDQRFQGIKQEIYRLDTKIDRLEAVFMGKFNLLYALLGLSLSGTGAILFKLFHLS